MAYGDKRDYKKIDIYKRGRGVHIYLASTTWAKNLKDAREQFAIGSKIYAASDLIAYYSNK